MRYQARPRHEEQFAACGQLVTLDVKCFLPRCRPQFGLKIWSTLRCEIAIREGHHGSANYLRIVRQVLRDNSRRLRRMFFHFVTSGRYSLICAKSAVVQGLRPPARRCPALFEIPKVRAVKQIVGRSGERVLASAVSGHATNPMADGAFLSPSRHHVVPFKPSSRAHMP
jgi:hypothetical protein